METSWTNRFLALGLAAMFTLIPSKAHATYPVFDAVSNTLHLKDLAKGIEELRAQIENLTVVQQILTVNRELADIQNNISSAVGDVRDVMNKAQYYASRIMGTINYWKNFDISKLIPFFDPKVFEAYRSFLNLKDNIDGLKNDISNFKVQSGQPLAYLTMETYYNKYTLMQSLQRAQQINRWGAEIGDARMQNEGLSKINEMTKAGTRELGRIASIVNDIAFQTLDESLHMAVIEESKREGYNKVFRATYDADLNL